MVHIHLEPVQETILAVTLGAVLATAGGFLSSQLEMSLRRRERARFAALLFAEILLALQLILESMAQAREHGDPYGPITMRILRAAVREAQTYDRNRELLMDLRTATLRSELHALLVRLRLGLEALLEMEIVYRGSAGGAAETKAEMDRSFEYTMDLAGRIPGFLDRLERMSGETLAHSLAALRRELDVDPAPAGT